MRLYVISVEIILHSVYKFLDVFMIVTMLGMADTCSPPKKTDSYSTYSLLERAERAKIIIVGSVVEFDSNDRRSVTASIGVHVKLKGDNVSRIVNVTGFNASRNKKNIMFHSMDCTGTTVELFGTYLFFIKLNRNRRSYTIDEIHIQPAAERIPCARHLLSKDMKRLLNKYRKVPLRSNQVTCFKRTKTVKNCLRKNKRWKATFWRLVNKFTHGNVRPRTVFCSTVKQHQPNISATNYHRRMRKQHAKLRDFIPMRKLLPDASLIGPGSNKDIYARSRSRRHFVYRRTDTTISVFSTSSRMRYPQNSESTLSAVRKEDIKVISDWQVMGKPGDDIVVSSSATTLFSRILTLVVASCLANLIFLMSI